MENVYARFEALYESTYGKGTAYREAGMEIVNFRLRATGAARRATVKTYPEEGKDPSGALKGRRRAYSDVDAAYLVTPVYEYEGLRPGNSVDGPAVIETPVTTIVVDAERQARMDRYRNIILEVKR